MRVLGAIIAGVLFGRRISTGFIRRCVVALGVNCYLGLSIKRNGSVT